MMSGVMSPIRVDALLSPAPLNFPIAAARELLADPPRSDERTLMPRSAADCAFALLRSETGLLLARSLIASTIRLLPPAVAAFPTRAARMAGTPLLEHVLPCPLVSRGL